MTQDVTVKMTVEQFAFGWRLLTTQPWGMRYGKATEISSTIQLELYWKFFQHVPPALWLATSELMATGEAWPSIQEMRTAMQANWPKPIESLIHTKEPIPEAIQQILAYQEAYHSDFATAVHAVLPQWIKEQPIQSPELTPAKALLAHTKKPKTPTRSHSTFGSLVQSAVQELAKKTSQNEQNDHERGDPTPAPISARLLPNPTLND